MSSLQITAIPEFIYFLDVIKDMPQRISFSMSLYISKQDPIKTINDLTFSIGISRSEEKTINNNQRDIDIIQKSKEDASELRKKIQTENQEIYSIKIILTFCSFNLNNLYKNIQSVKSSFYSKGIMSEITNFRHLSYYLDNIPLNYNNTEQKIYMTTDSLSNIFPFYIQNIIDENGIIVGKTDNNNLCIVDIFSNKYENSNICIFGCSGSGKSFFTKLYIIRNYFLGIKQIVLDVEDEYSFLNSIFNNTDKIKIINMKEIIKNSNEACKILKKIQENLGIEKTIIYIDEVWKYSSSEDLLSEIFNMYKTIRKKKAAIVTITQDVLDFFEYKNGRYAKSILNNSCFKYFFKANYTEVINDLGVKFAKEKLNYLKKGETILTVNNNNLKVSIKPNDFEREIMYVDDNSIG